MKVNNNLCTEGGNRTHTSVRTLDFESSASTSFATSAAKIIYNQFIPYSNKEMEA